MLPTRDQIERAAYDRWERRGYFHGTDADDWIAAEMDLTFDLNYQQVCDYSLGESQQRILDARLPRCRFCEQAPPRASFSAPRPVVPELVASTSLHTRAVCDECSEQFARSIDRDFGALWSSLEPLRSGAAPCRAITAPSAITVGAYKALVRSALVLVPERELSSFTDTIEWVGNPDHEFDSRLFGGAGCLAYMTQAPITPGWVGLFARSSDDAPFPSMLFFLGSERLVLQVHLPLGARDEDLDGAEVRIPQRSFSSGPGPDYRISTCMVLPLRPAEQARPRRFRLF